MAVFFTAEFLDEEKPILPMIDELVKKLKNSLVLKSKSHRLKILVDDINKNRYRVKSILTNLNNVQEDDITSITWSPDMILSLSREYRPDLEIFENKFRH